MEVEALLPDARPEVTLHPGRRRPALIVLVAGLFTASGVWLVRTGPAWLGWVTIVLFGVCALAGLMMLVPGGVSLRLSREGFETRAFGSERAERWADIARFGVFEMSPLRGRKTPRTLGAVFPATRAVGYDYVDGYEGHERSRAVSKKLNGFEGALFDTYGLEADDLARVLNAWRERHG